jgi:hypothetical protein
LCTPDNECCHGKIYAKGYIVAGWLAGTETGER